MTNEEIIQEMLEQIADDNAIGYRDHHHYDDTTYAQIEVDYD